MPAPGRPDPDPTHPAPARNRTGTPPLAARDAQPVWQHLDWMRQRGLQPGTIYQRRRALTRLAAALPCALLAAGEPDLAAWRAGLSIGAATIATNLAHVREFYRWAADTGLIDASPARRLLVPRTGRRLPRPISEASLIDALEYAPPRIRPWLVLAGWAGLRACEIALLRRECVLDHAQAPALLIAADATKGHRERIVPMSAFVLAELSQAGLPARGWVFPRGDGAPGPNTPGLVSGLANKWLHRCGQAATLHQLRHRFGTQAYHATHDLRAVQEVLGHAHPSTTAGYAAYDSAAAIEAVSRIPLPPWWQAGHAGPGTTAAYATSNSTAQPGEDA